MVLADGGYNVRHHQYDKQHKSQRLRMQPVWFGNFKHHHRQCEGEKSRNVCIENARKQHVLRPGLCGVFLKHRNQMYLFDLSPEVSC